MTSERASMINRALEGIWTAIRRHHPEVPDAIVVLGSAAAGGKGITVGHYAPHRWDVDGGQRPEVLIAGELLRNLEDVLECLVHEAAHGLAHARGVKDTSNRGRYHNKRYRALAEELGLEVRDSDAWGVETSLSATVRTRYQGELEELRKAHEAGGRPRRVFEDKPARPPRAAGGGEGGDLGGDLDVGEDLDVEDVEDVEERAPSSGRATLECPCGRRMWIAWGDRADVFCGVCGALFERVNRRAA